MPNENSRAAQTGRVAACCRGGSYFFTSPTMSSGFNHSSNCSAVR